MLIQYQSTTAFALIGGHLPSNCALDATRDIKIDVILWNKYEKFFVVVDVFQFKGFLYLEFFIASSVLHLAHQCFFFFLFNPIYIQATKPVVN